MAQSLVPAVKGALVDATAAALPGIQVTWGSPRGDKDREWVFVGDVTGTQAAAAIGRSRRKETFRVEIVVSIVRPDVDDARAIADRAYELAGAIEDLLRADETLGLPGLIWARVEKTDLTEGVAGGERWAEVTVHVNCETRI
ncbi:hypothetical protein [Miltoncostaea oceani]|uniref:hypothetical protein n=1 Tax=Miltoncostaea oceani TaxID=2843216 RepID=UPI001C3C2CE0|nr:hypothetical protein [Miltoncostaea oceani]